MSESNQVVIDITETLALEAAVDQRLGVDQATLEERRASMRARHPAFNRDVYKQVLALHEQTAALQESTGSVVETQPNLAFLPLRAVVDIEPIS